jgi:hypothetical protein
MECRTVGEVALNVKLIAIALYHVSGTPNEEVADMLEEWAHDVEQEYERHKDTYYKDGKMAIISPSHWFGEPGAPPVPGGLDYYLGSE